MLPVTPGHLTLAYVGPGLGAGTLIIVLLLVLSVLAALLVLVWYPLRRLLRRLRGQRDAPPEDERLE